MTKPLKTPVLKIEREGKAVEKLCVRDLARGTVFYFQSDGNRTDFRIRTQEGWVNLNGFDTYKLANTRELGASPVTVVEATLTVRSLD